MEELVRILCVDDEANVLKSLERIFMDDEYEILTALSGQEGMALLEASQPVHVVISDYRMPEMNGVDFLSMVCSQWPDTVRIVLSGYADTAAVVSAINEGQVYKFIPKPWNDDDLRITIGNAVERYFLARKNIRLTRELQEKNEELNRVNYNLERLVAEKVSRVMFQNCLLTRAQQILDCLPVAVIGLDMKGMVVQCNREGAALFGVPAGVMIDAERHKMLPAAVNAFVDELLARDGCRMRLAINGGEVVAFGTVIRQKDQEGVVLVFESRE